YGIGLTADFDAARGAVFMRRGEPASLGSFGSLVDRGLARIVPIVRNSRRPGARQVVVHINDGFNNTLFDNLDAVNELKAEGATVIVVSLPNLAGDHLAENAIRPYASTPAHYLVADREAPLREAINRVLRHAASAACLGYNLAPEVSAGSSTYLPDLTQAWVPGASYTDDRAPGNPAPGYRAPGNPGYLFSWTQVSGPAPAEFSDARTLNPSISFPVAGAYQLQLSVSDGQLTGRDRITI
ncbi:MAG: VWA domain-containing protein, partial [Akkermansiaceae bacterium]|nr:VWA domain-containing protein [Akkermansiaceae bacterium]